MHSSSTDAPVRSASTPHVGDLPRRVAFFPTCMADLASPEPALAAVRVLERLGCRVTIPAGMTCCGQPALNSGHAGPAKRLLRSYLDAAEGFDAVVTIAGSCASTVVHQGPRLLGDLDARPGYARLWEFSQFVDAFGAELPLRLAASVTYHDSCHMTRMLGETHAPRAVLGRIEGLTLMEMLASDDCCGFGGTFSVKFPEVSAAMADQKLRHAEATHAAYIVSADPGCLVHLAARSARTGVGPQTLHIAELVDLALGGRS